jgi:hypothetical protein
VRVRCEHSFIYGQAGARLHNAPRRLPGLWVLVAVLLAASLPSLARGPIGGRDADYQMAISRRTSAICPTARARFPRPYRASPGFLPQLYGVVLVRVDGKVWEAGDTRVPFVLSGVSAPFTAALVGRAGRVPTQKFARCRRFAGHACARDTQQDADAKWRAVLAKSWRLRGRDLFLDDSVYRSANTAAAPVLEMARRLAATANCPMTLPPPPICTSNRRRDADGLRPRRHGGHGRQRRQEPAEWPGRRETRGFPGAPGAHRQRGSPEDRHGVGGRQGGWRHRRGAGAFRVGGLFAAARCRRQQCSRPAGGQVPVASAHGGLTAQ